MREILKHSIAGKTESAESPPLLTEQQVAQALAPSVATLRKWRTYGRGPRYLKVGAQARCRADALTAWLNTPPTGGEALAEVAP